MGAQSSSWAKQARTSAAAGARPNSGARPGTNSRNTPSRITPSPITTPRDRTDRTALIALALIALAIIFFLPGAMNRWILPKEVILAIACVFAALATPVGRLPRWLLIATGIAALILVIASLAGA